jgi:hypothetical protein
MIHFCGEGTAARQWSSGSGQPPFQALAASALSAGAVYGGVPRRYPGIAARVSADVYSRMGF